MSKIVLQPHPTTKFGCAYLTTKEDKLSALVINWSDMLLAYMDHWNKPLEVVAQKAVTKYGTPINVIHAGSRKTTDILETIHHLLSFSLCGDGQTIVPKFDEDGYFVPEFNIFGWGRFMDYRNKKLVKLPFDLIRIKVSKSVYKLYPEVREWIRTVSDDWFAVSSELKKGEIEESIKSVDDELTEVMEDITKQISQWVSDKELAALGVAELIKTCTLKEVRT